MTANPSPHQSNARLGLILFFVYSLFYLAFAFVNAFFPDLATWRPAAGINLTTWWGLALIAFAFVLSMIYGWLCRSEQPSTNRQSNQEAQ